MIKLIYCIDKKNGFGKNNSLPWNIEEEIKHFKKTTLNHVVLMGHNTYNSLYGLLPKRENIIFSYNKKIKIDGAIITDNIDYIVERSIKEDIYIIGGKQIYELFIPFADEIIESILKNTYDTDMSLELNKNSFYLTKTIEKKTFKINYYKSKILSGYKMSKIIKNELIVKKNELVKKYKDIPKLMIIQVGNDFASSIYIKNKYNLAKEIGIKVQIKKFEESTTKKIINFINKCNHDDSINGILIQLPLTKNIDTNLVLSHISPEKDIDCLTTQNIGKLFVENNENGIKPCTPNGIIKILKRNNIKIESKNVVIIGRSNIVGKPLSLLLLNENATVTICHSKTKNIINFTKTADILISAVGIANLITANMVKDGVVIIDVGINRYKNNKICGDINFNDVLHKASFITPVPRGIGPMTLVMLYNNLLVVYESQKRNNRLYK